MDENPWINCEKELPYCDGAYEILDNEDSIIQVLYDGYGFLIYQGNYIDGHYNVGYVDSVKYWRYIPNKKRKRYGKIKDE